MKRCIIILILSCCTVQDFAQAYIDSLKKLIIKVGKEDTAMVDRLVYLSDFYIYNKPDSGIYFANNAIRLSQKLLYRKGEAWAIVNLGDAYWVLGDYALSMQYYLQSLNVFQQMKRPIGVSSAKYGIGEIYKEMSNHKQALQYYFEARKLDEENADDIKLLFPDTSLDARLKMCDILIADAYLAGNMLDSALFFARRGFIKDRELGHDWAYPALVLGKIYTKRNLWDSAFYFYKLTFKRKAQNDWIDIINGIATIFFKRNQPDSCHYYAKMAFDSAQVIHYRKGAMQSSELLSWVYEKTNPVQAIPYYKTSLALKDSLYDNEKLNQVHFLTFREKQKEMELLAANTKYQNQLKFYGLLSVIVFVLLLAVLLWRNNQHRKTAYTLLQKQTENELQIQKLESERIKSALQQQATELEMQALRSQMNPHFIFNCLSSINRFILKNETEAASDYLTKFSRLIRMVLNNSKNPLVLLEDELEMLRLYLDLERLRFKNSFDYSIVFHNHFDVASIFIPPLLLQPFAENAIWHGLMHKEGNGALEIAFELEDNMLKCYITDNGIGRIKAATFKSKSAEKQKSMGMQITAGRLALLNHEIEQTFLHIEDLVDDKGQATGTKVTLKIRYRESIKEFS